MSNSKEAEERKKEILDIAEALFIAKGYEETSTTDILERVLKNMLTEARWCSADPLCSSAKHQGFASLNYAACHACTLLPETSCEIQNVLLDRISVVGKTEDSETGFFGEILNNI